MDPSTRVVLRECDDCGLVQTVPSNVEAHEVAHCSRCDHLLVQRHRRGVELSLCCCGLALLLFAMALGSTVMSLHAAGRFSSATLFTGPSMLVRRGTWQLGTLVIVTLIVMPGARLVIMSAAGVAAFTRRPSRTV